MNILCRFHAKRVIPPQYHAAYVLYEDAAGIEPMCKASLDARLDSADDDPDLEPKGFWFIQCGELP